MSAMRKFSVLLLLIPLVLLTGLYFFFSYQTGGICLKPPTCTADIQTLCHPTNKSIWQGSSSCSCGLDASILESRGWTRCEVPEGYQGKIQTRSALIELSSLQLPKSLPLFIVPIVSLSIGIGAIIILWGKRE